MSVSCRVSLRPRGPSEDQDEPVEPYPENSAPSKLRRVKVVVLAPRFPSINQPWMDTYLEQLQRRGMLAAVASTNRQPLQYHRKVDDLRLRDYVVLVRFGRGPILYALLRSLLMTPAFALRHIWNSRGLLLKRGGKREGLGELLRAMEAACVLDRTGTPDVIHAHSIGMAFAFLPTAMLHGVPMVVTFHGLMPRGVPQVDPARRQAVFEGAARVLVNTEHSRKQLVALGCDRGKISVVPQGLPLEDFPLSCRLPPAPGEALRLLTVGRLQRDKGQAYALLALRRMVQAGLAVEWVFVGSGEDRSRLQTLAEKLAVSRHVAFHSALRGEELREFYQHSHLFVLPSRNHRHIDEHVETQGVVLQEAQASGCIPIATNVGGIPECIDHEVDGLLVRDRSHRSIHDAVVTMLQMPAGGWLAMQRNGRRKVRRKFSAEIVGERMRYVLSSVIRD